MAAGATREDDARESGDTIVNVAADARASAAPDPPASVERELFAGPVRTSRFSMFRGR